MTCHIRLSSLAACLVLLLSGCGIDGTYEPTLLPSHIKSAVLYVKDGRGQLRVEGSNKVFIANGIIDDKDLPVRSFSLVNDSKDDGLPKYTFIWRPFTSYWDCPECIKPKSTKPNDIGSIQWSKK